MKRRRLRRLFVIPNKILEILFYLSCKGGEIKSFGIVFHGDFKSFVFVIPWNHMNMEMDDGLSRGWITVS